MATLRINLLGSVRLTHGDWPSAAGLPRAGQSLFAYLLLHRDRTHRREVIADTFWGDIGAHRARNCLNTALWRLRRVLEPDGIPRGAYLTTTGAGEIGFNWASDHWLDVATFEDRVKRVLARPARAMEANDIRTLERALALYTGELLEGFYDDWTLRERERLHRLYLNSLAHLMRSYGQRGATDDALRYGQRILELDPLREDIQREMMRLYLASGRRARAVRQYEACCQVLARELGVEPMPETQAIYAEARRSPGQLLEIAPALDLPEPGEYQRALQELRLAKEDLAQAQLRLLRAIQLVEQLGGHSSNGKSASD